MTTSSFFRSPSLSLLRVARLLLKINYYRCVQMGEDPAGLPLNLVCFDEIDALCRSRGSLSGDTSGVRDSVVNQVSVDIPRLERFERCGVSSGTITVSTRAIVFILHARSPVNLDFQCSWSCGDTPPPMLLTPTIKILSKMDGLVNLQNVLVVGMTNRKELLDEALLRPGRMEVRCATTTSDQICVPEEYRKGHVDCTPPFPFLPPP